jgi:hypothetical protein
MNYKNVLYLFAAVVIALIASGYVQSFIALPADPVFGGVGVPLVTGGVLTMLFIVVRKFIFNKNDV